MSLKLLTVIILFLLVGCTVPIQEASKVDQQIDPKSIRLIDASTGKCLRVWASDYTYIYLAPQSECKAVTVLK